MMGNELGFVVGLLLLVIGAFEDFVCGFGDESSEEVAVGIGVASSEFVVAAWDGLS